MDLKQTVLGLEIGSTRIKAVLMDRSHQPLASGGYSWQSSLLGGVWTYALDEMRKGVQQCYAELAQNVQKTYGITLTTVGAIGISGMMHGYLPFDAAGEQLTEFRTWRNTMTAEAAEKLTALFGFNIPQRWSVAHLYQAMLRGEGHLPHLHRLTTAAGYIHGLLTGTHVVGVGEASGMFPIDSEKVDYDETMVEKFDALVQNAGYGWRIREVLPKVLTAGQPAGVLTEAGARLLDPSGTLQAGIPFCPPEGDAGTGMVATNAVRVHTGNVSAGTSIFAMLVADHPLGMYRQISMVTTPAGRPVAMVHCSNGCADLDAWVGLFDEFSHMIGAPCEKGELYGKLFQIALGGERDCGGLLSFNYLAGEMVTALDAGRPVFARLPDAKLTLANFMRTQLSAALATLRLGMDILTQKEAVRINKLCGHGGFFKTPGVGQRLLSAAVNAPVTVMQSAGEGGPYGMALLAAYMLWKKDAEPLEDYLDGVFADAAATTVMADSEDVAGFNVFAERFEKALAVERAAVETM